MNGEALPAARVRQTGERTWHVDVDDSAREHIELVADSHGEARVILSVEDGARLDERAVRGLMVALHAARHRAWSDEERA